MCGFVAFINGGSEERLTKAALAIAHRGPDNQNVYWDHENNSGFAHRRLSIIDLSEQANQPFWNTDKTKLIVFNGEIFNYTEVRDQLRKKGVSFLTDSDTEVILKGYEVLGNDILDQLNGMFSFVIYDFKKRTLFAARDRLGIKPFYYYHNKKQLFIASEIKAILAGMDSFEPDFTALSTPIYFQTAPSTGFQNIAKLEPGHYMTFTADGNFDINRYWELSVDESPTWSFDEKVEQLDELLKSSVKYQMVADVPVGVLLSGGLDSSLIAALMEERTGEQINSFTIKMNSADLKKQGIGDDSYYARQVANNFHFKHNELTINPEIINLLPKMVHHLEEVLVDPAAINTYLISNEARKKGITVLLSGIGADEIFGGYRIHRAMNAFYKWGVFASNPLTRNMHGIVKNCSEKYPGSAGKYIRWFKKLAFLLSFPDDRRFLFAKDAALTPEAHQGLFKQVHNYFDLHHPNKELQLFNQAKGSYLNKICYVDTHTYLTDHNLNYLDKAMMAAGVEGRPPFIDHRIVEFAFQLQSSDKIYKGNQKHLVKKVAEKYLKHNIIYRPKAPFAAPLRSWITHDLKEMVFDLLEHNKLKQRNLYNPAFVASILDQHYKRGMDHSQLIFRFLVTELWFQIFFDNYLFRS